MTGIRVRICTAEEKWPVKVPRTKAKMQGFPRIGVFNGLPERLPRRVGDQTP